MWACPQQAGATEPRENPAGTPAHAVGRRQSRQSRNDKNAQDIKDEFSRCARITATGAGCQLPVVPMAKMLCFMKEIFILSPYDPGCRVDTAGCRPQKGDGDKDDAESDNNDSDSSVDS